MAQEGRVGEANAEGSAGHPQLTGKLVGAGWVLLQGTGLLGPASGRPSAHVLWAECCRALTHRPVAAWQGVERDLRSQLSGGERGLVEEYVEKVPNPSLKSEWGDLGEPHCFLPKAPRWGPCSEHQPDCPLTAFKPIDLSDLKRRNTQDAKKS